MRSISSPRFQNPTQLKRSYFSSTLLKTPQQQQKDTPAFLNFWNGILGLSQLAAQNGRNVVLQDLRYHGVRKAKQQHDTPTCTDEMQGDAMSVISTIQHTAKPSFGKTYIELVCDQRLQSLTVSMLTTSLSDSKGSFASAR